MTRPKHSLKLNPESVPWALTGNTSKLGVLIANLGQPNGATLDELVGATGWQKHSVRGAISGALKVKHKLNVKSDVVEGRGRVYRIINEVTATSDKDEVLPVSNGTAAQS